MAVLPPPPGIVIAAPSSGSGKTLVTLGLIRALVRRGLRVASAKVGPDYIDPAYHSLAGSRACETLDGWAMRESTRDGVLARLSENADAVVCEGVMGLFDGATGGGGSSADIAAWTGWPVVLVVDVRGMAASVAALVQGFASHRTDLRVAGVILNHVASDRHLAMLEAAIADHCPGISLLGGMRRNPGLTVPSRHLGLVQAGEQEEIDAVIGMAADAVAADLDLDLLLATAQGSGRKPSGETGPSLPPLGQKIAVARDIAFAFSYPHLIEGWRRAGAEVACFSPLDDEPPAPDADAVYLPGGYPELHAGRLAGNQRFMTGLQAAADRGAVIYGECGGYMTLGDVLIDADGIAHAMAGLLKLETSFEKPERHLGYRRMVLAADMPFGQKGAAWRGHEFHYSRTLRAEGEPLFTMADATGNPLGETGLVAGRVSGSYLHVIDREGSDG
jgi:cobyrinic acid a,c-diamide synthase